MRKNIWLNVGLGIVTSLWFTLKAYAVCPVCTVALVGGVGLSRWLKVDDTITGIWLGAATASLTGWIINWLNDKNIKFKGRKALLVIIDYGSVLATLYFTKMINHPLNKLWGIDKLLLGMGVGTILFLLGLNIHRWVRNRNNQKSYFPFQRNVIILITLLIFSVCFYFITKISHG